MATYCTKQRYQHALHALSKMYKTDVPISYCFSGELVKEHAYGQARGIDALTLKNTKAENWAHSPWEIAKVFMPPAGYENKTTIEETDFNGIAAFIINCKRFRGKITGSICEKAREVVNHIRHMPDSCSSALTDQATTECIDKLHALLSEPALQTRSEVVQACKQLDELKTADISKDVHTCEYICQELHAEFQQRLADIELKLQTHIIDIESAKECIHTESKQFHKNLNAVSAALEHFSDNAMHDLLRTKDNILLSIKEERRRIMDHITFLERKATEHIEQSATDGKRTIEIYVREEKRQATEHIEHFVTDGKRTLEDQTERLVKRLRKEEVEHLEQKKHDLKKKLINHYKTTSVRMNVRLDIDAAVEDIYEKPKLILKNKNNNDGKFQDEDISEMNKMFQMNNGKMAKTIFVEGGPGSGKSVLCRKIVNDWCKLKQDSTKETHRQTKF
ncbi:uncharacterized protein LOC128230073 [Mya arenaria]|uniref:uncharacterized protein LOC128230073 n=1 Tax=Mya arenaria TaxID=6604 RepID=UPI0022E5475C|nr:uncharacterized protein LOC128230073 [Mya arenaria]